MGQEYFGINIRYLCNVKYTLLGLWNPLMCRVVVLEDSECRQHRAHSIIIVDTIDCIRECLRRQSILE